MSQTPLTNIIEDEEEPVDDEPNFKNDLNNLILINSTAAAMMSTSRRSSRGGGDNANTIAALTILEEVETDHVTSSNSFSNNTVRVSNSKLKLYPYSNKQTSDESNFKF